MGRLGERDPDAVVELARACAEDDRLELAGVWTHFATADERDDRASSAEQLAAFAPVADARARARAGRASSTPPTAPRRCASRRSHFDMVRCGVAIYGLDPFQEDPAEQGLEPALELRSYVADVKRFEAGASAGYGRTWRAPEDTWVGVLPIGYGDGVRRGALATTPRCWSAAAATRWSAPSRWTTSPSTSAPRPTSSRATRRC